MTLGSSFYMIATIIGSGSFSDQVTLRVFDINLGPAGEIKNRLGLGLGCLGIGINNNRSIKFKYKISYLYEDHG